MAVKIGTSNSHWFFRGVAAGLLLMAGVNAMSYFMLSGGFGSLLGYAPLPKESIGFPFEVWNDQGKYFGKIIDYRAVGKNFLVALVPACTIGIASVMCAPHFNRMIEEFESKEARSKNLSLQFSTRSMLVITTIAAVAIAALSTWRESRITLATIYLLGPAMLIILAMMPDSIRWYWRAFLLVLAAITMIGIAISTGMALDIPVDKVLFGIFVSWVPQSVFAAFAIMTWLIIHGIRNADTREKTHVSCDDVC